MKKNNRPVKEAASKQNSNNNTKKINPTDNKARRSVKSVLPSLSKARRRLLHHLFLNGPSTTGTLCSACSIGNLSDAVINTNPVIKKAGLMIINYPPPKPLVNVFGERTPVHVWELVELNCG
jgi:hypothetical protein